MNIATMQAIANEAYAEHARSPASSEMMASAAYSDAVNRIHGLWSFYDASLEVVNPMGVRVTLPLEQYEELQNDIRAMASSIEEMPDGFEYWVMVQ